MNNKPQPPIKSIGSKPSDFNMDGYIAAKDDDDNYLYRQTPERINKQQKRS